MRTRVKICGITRREDAIEASRLGVDAIGLVFYPRSKRFVDFATARSLAEATPAFVSVVGLFLDADAGFVREAAAEAGLELLQFHGRETPEYCEGFNLPFIKAIGMRGNIPVQSQVRQFTSCRGFLLDSHAPGEAGGTGETFDWDSLGQNHEFPLILAGGLTPENVASAIHAVRPWAVDLSSGVEAAPGIKDHGRMAVLMKEVMRVNCES